METVTRRISDQRPSFSIELFPPKDEAGEARMWASVEELAELAPDFFSVTYGAGGSTRDRTLRIAQELTAHTGKPTIAHLTCVGSSKAELELILAAYQSAGINQILALRGDPVGGPSAPWLSHPNGFDHADQLVELAVATGMSVGVAAFPDGHPASNGDMDFDIKVLARKAGLGASFATTQFFFEPERYFDLVNRLRDTGTTLPILPGILPITNFKQLERMAELSGTPVPNWLRARLDGRESDELWRIGVEIAFELCQELIAGGAPGIHFYTMNSARATKEILSRLKAQ